MSSPRFVAVIDIGKTNAKLALVDLETRQEVAVRTQPNKVVDHDPYPHFDTESIWEFLCDAIAEVNNETPIDAISITTHGASAALVDADGKLALPILDYEHDGPDACDADYAKIRHEFSESFTPPLPVGLNLAKQLYWQSQAFPDAFANTRYILLYPQYWAFRLTGIACSEITSIGCHTDLWDFPNNRFSSLVIGQGWGDKFAPLKRANEVVGQVETGLVRRLGLRPGVDVHVGIHDSNASLFPHLAQETPPFSVVSTGTWVVICAPGGDMNHLDPKRDSYANIDAFGQYVPSARFMGGREYSDLTGDKACLPDDATVRRILNEKIFLLPSVTANSGPFPDHKHRFTVLQADLSDVEKNVIISFYLAMMTMECLDLAGASGPIIVEGPFGSNNLYLEMLTAVSGRSVRVQRGNITGTSQGAALLASSDEATLPEAVPSDVTTDWQSEMLAYGHAWRAEIL